MAIPIENIYYLLCYAWNKLDEKDRVAVSADDFSELLDLLAKVLINSTRILLKRGIDRSYIDVTERFVGIKGKLELSQTVKSQLLLKQQTICSFDEFSADILTNQILVTTLHRLVKTRNLDKDLRSEIKSLLWRLGDIRPIQLENRSFNKIRLHRNNKFYDFILKVCELIHRNSLLSETSGDWHFMDFQRDEHKMNQLFEAFLRNFYALEQSVYRVRREDIHWQFVSADDDSSKFLPKMQTDITLESGTRKYVIDAKFYKETLKSNYGSEKIASGNLYQLFSYLLNQRGKGKHAETATGILLYPTIESEYDLEFAYQDHQILIKTVNLNSNWRDIRSRLLQIVGIS